MVDHPPPGKIFTTHYATPKFCMDCSLLADAEVMYVVSEVIAVLPGLQEAQFSLWVNHTSLLSSILTHCSVPEDKHPEAITLLHKMVVCVLCGLVN